MKRNTPFNKTISILTIVAFLWTSIQMPGSVSAQPIVLPPVGNMVNLTQPYVPVTVKGLKVNPENPFQFDFIIDPGDSGMAGEVLQEESTKLIKYFLASLTVPESDLWVNLSPYEEDRIIPEQFGMTEMGRELLAQDYLLKQLTSSLMYPEDGGVGERFWDRIKQKSGLDDIPVNTFNKVWIVPEEATVYEGDGVAYVVESRLKVMLESDYLAMQKGGPWSVVRDLSKNTTTEHRPQNTDVIKEIILPVLEEEVNSGTHFAPLRQIYNSLILASWYKRKLKNSVLTQVYVDQNKTKGVTHDEEGAAQKIYDQYVESFKTGVYDYIKEEYDPINQQIIPRKYFSGGFAAEMDKVLLTENKDSASLSTRKKIGLVAAAGVTIVMSVILLKPSDEDVFVENENVSGNINDEISREEQRNFPKNLYSDNNNRIEVDVLLDNEYREFIIKEFFAKLAQGGMTYSKWMEWVRGLKESTAGVPNLIGRALENYFRIIFSSNDPEKERQERVEKLYIHSNLLSEIYPDFTNRIKSYNDFLKYLHVIDVMDKFWTNGQNPLDAWKMFKQDVGGDTINVIFSADFTNDMAESFKAFEVLIESWNENPDKFVVMNDVLKNFSEDFYNQVVSSGTGYEAFFDNFGEYIKEDDLLQSSFILSQMLMDAEQVFEKFNIVDSGFDSLSTYLGVAKYVGIYGKDVVLNANDAFEILDRGEGRVSDRYFVANDKGDIARITNEKYFDAAQRHGDKFGVHVQNVLRFFESEEGAYSNDKFEDTVINIRLRQTMPELVDLYVKFGANAFQSALNDSVRSKLFQGQGSEDFLNQFKSELGDEASLGRENEVDSAAMAEQDDNTALTDEQIKQRSDPRYTKIIFEMHKIIKHAVGVMGGTENDVQRIAEKVQLDIINQRRSGYNKESATIYWNPNNGYEGLGSEVGHAIHYILGSEDIHRGIAEVYDAYVHYLVANKTAIQQRSGVFSEERIIIGRALLKFIESEENPWKWKDINTLNNEEGVQFYRKFYLFLVDEYVNVHQSEDILYDAKRLKDFLDKTKRDVYDKFTHFIGVALLERLLSFNDNDILAVGRQLFKALNDENIDFETPSSFIRDVVYDRTEDLDIMGDKKPIDFLTIGQLGDFDSLALEEGLLKDAMDISFRGESEIHMMPRYNLGGLIEETIKTRRKTKIQAVESRAELKPEKIWRAVDPVKLDLVVLAEMPTPVKLDVVGLDRMPTYDFVNLRPPEEIRRSNTKSIYRFLISNDKIMPSDRFRLRLNYYKWVVSEKFQTWRDTIYSLAIKLSHPEYEALEDLPVEESDDEKDSAMIVKQDPANLGGIDLNPANWELKTKGMQGSDCSEDGFDDCLKFDIPQEQIEQLRLSIDGLVPVIINVQPVTNLPLFLGLADELPDEKQPQRESEEELVLDAFIKES